MRDGRDCLRAARALLVGVPMYLVEFAAIYIIVAGQDDADEASSCDRTSGRPGASRR